jgi:hypothetical protein
MLDKAYNHNNCLSLFGYARGVHRRSGGVCQYCQFGKQHPLDFNLWRQLSVEHVISTAKGASLADIRKAVQRRFPDLSDEQAKDLSTQIDAMNTITACRLCNSLTSWWRDTTNLSDLVLQTPGKPEQVRAAISSQIERIREEKSDTVRRKLSSIEKAFETEIRPELEDVRRSPTV